MRPTVVAGVVLIATAAFAGPKAELSTHTIDLGVIEQGKVVEVPLSVRNTGDAPLTIKKIQFSCHCVSARELTPQERVVPPGAEQPLPIRYDPMNYIGARQAVIAVTTDDPERPFLEARLNTTIVAPVVITPRVLRWGPTVRGTTLEADVRIKPGVAGNHLELLSIDVPHPGIEFSKAISDDNGEIVVDAQFTVADTARLGELNTILEAQVKLDDRQFPVRAPLSLFVMGDVLVRPPQIVSINRPISPGEQISTIALLWTRPEQPVELLDVRVAGDVRTDTRPMPDRFEIDVFVTENAAPGPAAARVDLFSTSMDEPVASVPIYFLVRPLATVEPAALVIDAGNGAAEARATVRPVNSGHPPRAVSTAMNGLRVELTGDIITATFDGDTPALPLTGYVALELTGAPAVRVPVLVQP